MLKVKKTSRPNGGIGTTIIARTMMIRTGAPIVRMLEIEPKDLIFEKSRVCILMGFISWV